MIQFLQDGDLCDQVIMKLWLLNELLFVDHLDCVLFPSLLMKSELHSSKVTRSKDHLCQVIRLVNFQQLLVVLRIPMLLREILINQNLKKRRRKKKKNQIIKIALRR
jgi:hypothetical protein